MSQHPPEEHSALVYDPMDQYPEYDVLRPKRREYPESAEELAGMLNKAHIFDASKHSYRLLVIDEAARVAPARQKLHPAIAKLNAEHRHIPLAILWICQRPRQLNNNIVDLADHVMIFKLPGVADRKYADDQARGLGDTVASLKRFQFVYMDIERNYYVIDPVPEVPAPAGT